LGGKKLKGIKRRQMKEKGERGRGEK